MLNEEIQTFLLNDSLKRFLEYVKVWTTSKEDPDDFPSTEIQFDLGKKLVEELKEIGLENVIHDDFGYVYGRLPASEGFEDVQPIGLIAHLDTSPAVSGKDVKPVIHEKYEGGKITFTKDPEMTLSVEDSPQLHEYKGLDIVTSQGDTLLGADDKAGIAEIITACAAFQKFDELKHGPIAVCFFPDEEIGKGADHIDLEKIPNVCYTFDGSEMGELEIECFDAWRATFKFKGLNVHPGYAKNLMINAIHIASRFMSEIPEAESPENTEEREGFYHLTGLEGNVEEATARMIIRDFDSEVTERRMDYIKKLKSAFETRYPGLNIELNFEHQYQNMYEVIKKNEKVFEKAKEAISTAGLEVIIHPIRGGTDGAHLAEDGIPTPNIFSGGLMFHSRKEYIPTKALQKAAEVIINLAKLWTEN